MRSRTQLINHVRGTVKSFGARLPGCSARSFHKKVHDGLPPDLVEGLGPVLETIASLTERIGDFDRHIEKMAAERYPQTGLLSQVQGVGTLTALTFVLTLEDPTRFGKSRTVGAYLGLVPGTDRSGDSDPQKRISGAGDEMLRGMLVRGAHYILGPFADRRLRPQAPRPEDRRAGRQERQEAGGGGGGQEALRAAPPPLGLRGGLRAATQRPTLGDLGRGGGLRDTR